MLIFVLMLLNQIDIFEIVNDETGKK